MELVRERLAALRFYGLSSRSAPRVEVFGASGITVHFVGDYVMECWAQSGSDWATHYIYVGEAVCERGVVVSSSIRLADERFIPESSIPDYDADSFVATVRAAAIAKQGEPAAESESLVHPAVVTRAPTAPVSPGRLTVLRHAANGSPEIVRAAAIAKPAEPAPMIEPATRPAAEAPTVPASSGHQTIVRCPKCGSTDYGAEASGIELTRMTCRGCGHDTFADRYQISDEWMVEIDLPPGTTHRPQYMSPWFTCPRCHSTNVGEAPDETSIRLTCYGCMHNELIDPRRRAKAWRG